MYLTAEENARMLSIIRDKFDNAKVFMECLAKRWVNKEHTEKSIQDTGAKFVFGADTFDDLGKAADGFRCVKNDDIVRDMAVIMPILKPFKNSLYSEKSHRRFLYLKKHNPILSADLSAGRLYSCYELHIRSENFTLRTNLRYK